MGEKKLFETFGTGERILKLLKSEEKWGGPQSVEDVCKNLRMTNRNARSILSRLSLKGKIERIGKGVYNIKGDTRPYKKNRTHFNG